MRAKDVGAIVLWVSLGRRAGRASSSAPPRTSRRHRPPHPCSFASPEIKIMMDSSAYALRLNARGA